MSLASRSARLTLALVMMAFLPGLARAAEIKAHSFELSVLPTFIRFDSQSGLNNKIAYSYLLGYNFTPRHGGELLYTSTTAKPDTGRSFPTDVEMIRAGYIFNAQPKQHSTSFFRVGVGRWKIDPQDLPPNPPSRLAEPHTGTMIYSGGGWRVQIWRFLSFRISGTIDLVDYGDGFLKADVQATGEAGLVFLIGGRSASEAPPAPAPGTDKKDEGKKKEEEKKPEAPPAETKPPGTAS
jgi:hypothetical protein